MCFHSKQSKKAQEAEKRFNAKVEDKANFLISDHINAFTFPKTPVITNEDYKLIQNVNWGLIPHWAKDNEIRKYTVNAKIETINDKPAFRDSTNNRCIILSDGFYEWQWQDSKGQNKIKHLIELKDKELYAYGGIYSEWYNITTGQTEKTYAMVTTEAKGIMRKVHNSKMRMPVILTKQNEQQWLNGNNLNEFKDLPSEIVTQAISGNYRLF